MGEGLTSADQLKRLCERMNVQLDGIYDFGAIPDLKHGYYIFNIHPEDSFNGHWVCAHYVSPIMHSGSAAKSIYFDSYGLVPPVPIANLLGTFDYNTKQIQALKGTWCGQYCCAALKAMQDNNYLNFIGQFS